MPKISLGFSTPKEFHVFPWLIKYIEGTKFSHTYIRIKSQSLDRDLIYQASGLKVNFDNKQNFENVNEIIEEYEVYITDETYRKVLQYAIDNLGSPYSLKQCCGIAWIRFLKLFGISSRNPIRDGKRGEICTELVAGIIEDCLGVDIAEDLDSVGLRELHYYVAEIIRTEKIIKQSQL
jgi:hypothetical protein